jgi:hypothetical protein
MAWPTLLSAFAAGLIGAETPGPGAEVNRLCLEPVAWAVAALEEAAESRDPEDPQRLDGQGLDGQVLEGVADPAAVLAAISAGRNRFSDTPLICLAGGQNDPRCALHNGDSGESPWSGGPDGKSRQPALATAGLRHAALARAPRPSCRHLGERPGWRRRLDRPPR